MDRKKSLQLILLCSLLGGMVGSVLTLILVRTVPGGGVVPNRSAWTAPFVSPSSEEAQVVGVVERANPAVVSITVSKNVPVLERYYDTPDFFDDWFGFGVPRLPLPQYRERGTELREVGGGSGFFVSADGHILTNRHVVDDNSAEYTVFTNDGKTHAARVVARDPVFDIAIIKIDGGNYPYLEFGDSDALRVGQTSIAIGNALGEFRNTVSVGVISGLARSVVAGDLAGNAEFLDQVIQTDAAINRGNSGGPLLGLNGKVVGVNVAVAAGSENIGFALPANVVRSAVESVERTGKIIRPYIGVRYQAVTPELQQQQNLPYDYGVLITRGNGTAAAVVPDSPADQAGLKENDIILEVDGVKLEGSHTLAGEIRQKAVGDTVRLRVWQQGTVRTISLRLSAMPEAGV